MMFSSNLHLLRDTTVRANASKVMLVFFFLVEAAAGKSHPTQAVPVIQKCQTLPQPFLNNPSLLLPDSTFCGSRVRSFPACTFVLFLNPGWEGMEGGREREKERGCKR